MNKKVVILHNAITESSLADEADVLQQVELVREALVSLGFSTEVVGVGNEPFSDIDDVVGIRPDFVFNLVESVYNKGELNYFGPAILNALQIPYTGNSLSALFMTTNKVLAKEYMVLHGIPTPEFFELSQLDKLQQDHTYILKPIWEEGSVGLDEENVFNSTDDSRIERIKKLSGNHYFVEKFIEGREFNMSMLGGLDGPKVLHPAEMIFKDFPDNKPKILGYRAKWDESSPEYKNTTRSFDTLDKDSALYAQLKNICLNCWKSFRLKGYARVDFRIDTDGNPYVIEINANPCISPDSGFIAAAHKAGYSNTFIIQKICEELN